MPWCRFDDGYWSNRKIIRARLAASGLDARAITWCAGALTDGFVPDDMLAVIAGGDPAAKKAAARLVEVGRWTRDDNAGGWWIHDYLAFNPSAASVLEQREADRQKKQRQRAKGAQSSTRSEDTGQYVSPRDTPGDAPRESRRGSPATRPDPTRPTVGRSPSQLTVVAPPADGEEGSAPPDDWPADVQTEARRRLDTKRRNGEQIANPPGLFRHLCQQVAAEHADRARTAAAGAATLGRSRAGIVDPDALEDELGRVYETAPDLADIARRAYQESTA